MLKSLIQSEKMPKEIIIHYAQQCKALSTHLRVTGSPQTV